MTINSSNSDGTTLLAWAYSNSATDTDAPLQTLTLSLDPGFRAGASIDPANGLFARPTSAAQAGTTNPVTVHVPNSGMLRDPKSHRTGPP